MRESDLRIELRGVGKRFARQWVIREFSDSFTTNEVIGIRGRNGSGKSTLLRLICGQLTPSRGQVTWTVGGKTPPVDSWYESVSWTGPYIELVEELTVGEFLRFHFTMKPAAKGLGLDDLLSLIELDHARERPLLDCSSGMRQRVLLCTGLMAATPVLLLDEPTVTLDRDARSWFQVQLSRRRAGRLVVIASNDEEDLQQCTRVIDLNSGI